MPAILALLFLLPPPDPVDVPRLEARVVIEGLLDEGALGAVAW